MTSKLNHASLSREQENKIIAQIARLSDNDQQQTDYFKKYLHHHRLLVDIANQVKYKLPL